MVVRGRNPPTTPRPRYRTALDVDERYTGDDFALLLRGNLPEADLDPPETSQKPFLDVSFLERVVELEASHPITAVVEEQGISRPARIGVESYCHTLSHGATIQSLGDPLVLGIVRYDRPASGINYVFLLVNAIALTLLGGFLR